MTAQESAFVHANALLIGEAGVLLRGPSGAGKSALTLELIDAARARGGFAALVGDDRVALFAHHGRVIATPHPAIAGRIEIRGRGIVEIGYEPACVLALIVDLMVEDWPPRAPELHETTTQLRGITLPLLRERSGAAAASTRIISFLRQLMTK